MLGKSKYLLVQYGFKVACTYGPILENIMNKRKRKILYL